LEDFAAKDATGKPPQPLRAVDDSDSLKQTIVAQACHAEDFSG
jgi:hypothetical protein